jgi:hypothetical protein
LKDAEVFQKVRKVQDGEITDESRLAEQPILLRDRTRGGGAESKRKAYSSLGGAAKPHRPSGLTDGNWPLAALVFAARPPWLLSSEIIGGITHHGDVLANSSVKNHADSEETSQIFTPVRYRVSHSGLASEDLCGRGFG